MHVFNYLFNVPFVYVLCRYTLGITQVLDEAKEMGND